jgi:hypothetical protein
LPRRPRIARSPVPRSSRPSRRIEPRLTAASAGGLGLPRSGFAHQPQGLSGLDGQADAADDLAESAGGRRVGDRQVLHDQQPGGPGLVTGAAAAGGPRRSDPGGPADRAFEGVAQRVAEQHQGGGHGSEHQARPDELEGGDVEVLEALGDHRPEAGRGRRSDAEEGQAGLDADGLPAQERGGDDDRPADREQHVPGEDAPVGQARDAGRVHEQLVPDPDDLVAHQPVDAGRQQHPEDRHGDPEVAAGQRHEHDEQQQPREGHHQPEHPLGAAPDPLVVAAHQTGRHADGQRDTGPDERRDHTCVDRVQQAGPDVPAAAVAAQRISGRSGVGVDVPERGRVGVVRGEQRREHARDDDEQQHARGEDRLRVAQQSAGRRPAARSARAVGDRGG